MSDKKSKMVPAFNITFPNGTYKKDGEEKTRWLNVGTLFIAEDKSRMAIKLDAIPTSNEFEGWLNVFPKRRENNGTTIDQAKAAESDDPIDIDSIQSDIDLSDIPF